ncbi:MAG: hypothetical protein M3R38_10385 [Actinomycetota bacterium]|nr:hypothetical protein [Actinomycetota bacterium]
MSVAARRGGRRDSRAGASPKPGDVVLDAGAVLAVLTEGPGYKRIETRLAAPGTAVIDAVSLLVAMTALSDHGLSQRDVQEVVDAMALRVEDLDEDLAFRAVEVGAEDRGGELSLPQRCSVALGRRLGLPVLAAGPEMYGLEGVEVADPRGASR